MDLWAWMPRLPTAELLRHVDPEPSADVRARIDAARVRQRERNGGTPNGRLAGRRLRRLAAPTPEAERRLVEVGDRARLSGRGAERLLRVARTIADLAGIEAVGPDHVAEAARFRLAAVVPAR